MSRGEAARLLAVVALASCCGCRCRPLSSAGGEVRAQPPALPFGDVWVGAQRTLELQNTGRAELRVTLEPAPPFGAEAEVCCRAER